MDTIHHLEALAAALDVGDPEEFKAYSRWLVKLLEPRGVPADDVRANFRAIGEVLEERLGAEAAAPSLPLLTTSVD
jgi:hypothetical protein